MASDITFTVDQFAKMLNDWKQLMITTTTEVATESAARSLETFAEGIERSLQMHLPQATPEVAAEMTRIADSARAIAKSIRESGIIPRSHRSSEASG